LSKIKRILAIAAVIILVGMYVTTLILSICDSSATMGMFKGCVALTIFIPIVSYCYICLHKYAMTRSGRRNYYGDSADNNTTGKQ